MQRDKMLQGNQFVLAELDDFELEVEQLKNSKEFMAFLDLVHVSDASRIAGDRLTGVRDASGDDFAVPLFGW